MKCRTLEFFENDDGRLSMTRLLNFLSIFPATYVLIKNPVPEMLMWFVGAYMLGYVGGKVADVAALRLQQPSPPKVNLQAGGQQQNVGVGGQ